MVLSSAKLQLIKFETERRHFPMRINGRFTLSNLNAGTALAIIFLVAVRGDASGR